MSKSILDGWWRSSLIPICSNGGCFEHLSQFDRFLGGGKVVVTNLKPCGSLAFGWFEMQGMGMY